MIPWLMSWGQAVQVLEPQWLKEELLKNLKNMINMYDKNFGTQ